MEMNNKVALVLGAIKGIGKGVGLALAEKGVRVVLTYYDWEENLEEMKQAFSQTGTEHLIIKINLLETVQIPTLIQKAVDRFNRLDIVINNIERGGWPVVHGPYLEEQWNLEMETTLRAKWWVFNSALPFLKASKDGIVINFSSIAAIVGRSGPAGYIFNEGYAAANRGVSLLTENWAKTGAPEVRVNEIMLGMIETRHGENTRGWNLLTESQKQAILDHTLLGRTGSIDEVIKTVLFLIQDATFMTGSVIRIDGGYVLGADKTAPMPEGVL